LEKDNAIPCRNVFYFHNGGCSRRYGFTFIVQDLMESLIDTINEIIATGDNCNLPYIQILGRKAKKQYVEEIIKQSRKNV